MPPRHAFTHWALAIPSQKINYGNSKTKIFKHYYQVSNNKREVLYFVQLMATSYPVPAPTVVWIWQNGIEFTPRLLPWGRVWLPVKWRVGIILRQYLSYKPLSAPTRWEGIAFVLLTKKAMS
jgi:hypothetical protein